MIVYKIITGKSPFYEFEGLNSVSLGIKVLNGERPSLDKGIPRKMRKLLSRCWSDDESSRPTFDEIVDLLTNDMSYFNESVDEDEISEYRAFIDEQSDSNFVKKPQNKLEKGIENLKKQISCSNTFNEDFALALHMIIGHEKEVNLTQAVRYLKSSSAKGNGHSSFALGLLQFNGRGTKKDVDEATKSFLLAASQGNSSGLNALRYYYKKGFGVKTDYAKAREFYQKAADLGNSYAMMNLSNIYQDGLGVEKDYKKAIQLLEMSIDLGNSDALNNLGYMYENGIGVEQNFLKAKDYYLKSGLMGTIDAYL